ncbi:pyrophosphorylase [Actinoplanes sp. NEAU-A12]|uniref:Pyrophosphorylase n=1 Tax=Actinoplanes sandaracinus TaxID=3045177 RepID=A0ABT6WYW2_9ACTN|nr:pyrophosphorylase [Actinoplanes sandaracinus]MDI6104796.1 pyrophosphorylase [Actinoplanes sandaracinus]
MATRVLSTEQAKTAISQMQAIISGGLAEQITKLDGQGQTLSDSNVWDGPLAEQFRGQIWPDTKKALDRAQEELGQLREQLNKISQNIMAAGGGG